MMTRPSRYSKRPLCPVCLTPFGNEALSIARSVLGLEEPHNDVLEEDPFDRDFMRGDVPGTRDEEFSLPQSYGTVYVPCPGGHETSAVYILSEVPTYLVSLVGLKSSGKTHLLTALARVALSDSSAILGYSVSIPDNRSRTTYQKLVDDLIENKTPLAATTATSVPLGLRFSQANASRRVHDFHVLFTDYNGELLDTDEGLTGQARHILAADLHLVLIPAETLLKCLAERRAVSRGATGASDAVVNLLHRLQVALEQAQQAGHRVSQESIVVLTKADLLATPDNLPILETARDEGEMRIPSTLARGAKSIGQKPWRYSFQGSRCRDVEWNAVFWQNVYGRIVLKIASERLGMTALRVLPRPLVALVSSTGCASEDIDGTATMPKFEPIGIIGLLVKLLYRLGALQPPDSLDPLLAAPGWLRQLSSP